MTFALFVQILVLMSFAAALLLGVIALAIDYMMDRIEKAAEKMNRDVLMSLGIDNESGAQDPTRI